MTTLDNTRLASSGLTLSAIATRVTGAVAAWNDARITRNSLTALSARELEDIGLCRGDIEEIAARGHRR